MPETQNACPLCGSRSIRSWRRQARDRLHDLTEREFDYLSCRDCGVRFLAQMPSGGELEELYPSDYGPYAAPARLESLFPPGPDRELESFYAPNGPDALLLDYGCGSPSFLDAARERGWRTAGADFTPAVVENVRESGHAGFLVGDELDQGITDAGVARVRMNHVLEHLPGPRSALAQIRRKLAPGGGIHIATPNPAGIGSVLFRTRWFSLDCPRHLLLYPPGTAADLLRDVGFRDVRVVHEVVSKDLARSWRYLLQDVGLSRRDTAAGRAAEGGTLLLRGPAKLAALASMSDRFHVLAEA